MIRGKYVIRSNGKVVCEAENLITTTGLQMIKNYLAGVGPRFHSFIAYGTGEVAPDISDSRLGFQAGIVPVTLGAVVSGEIVYKARIPEAEAGRFKELALFAEDISVYGSRAIATFDSSVDTITGGANDLTQGRFGLNSYTVSGTSAAPPSATQTFEVPLDLSDLSGSDEVTLSYFQNSGATSSVNVYLRTDSTKSLVFTFVPTPGLGYKTVSSFRSQATLSGAVNLASISSVKATFNNSAATNVSLDGLRINKAPLGAEQMAVSRALLPDVLLKNPGQQMDIEYRLVIA